MTGLAAREAGREVGREDPRVEVARGRVTKGLDAPPVDGGAYLVGLVFLLAGVETLMLEMPEMIEGVSGVLEAASDFAR